MQNWEPQGKKQWCKLRFICMIMDKNCLCLYRLPTTYRSVNLLPDNVSHGAQESGLHGASRTPPAQSDSYKESVQQSQMNTNYSILNAFFSCCVSFWFWNKVPFFQAGLENNHRQSWIPHSYASTHQVPGMTSVCNSAWLNHNGYSIACFQNTVTRMRVEEHTEHVWSSDDKPSNTQGSQRYTKEVGQSQDRSWAAMIAWLPHGWWLSRSKCREHHCSCRVRIP